MTTVQIREAMLLEGTDKPKVKQLSVNRMKKQLLKIGCLLPVLFLFTSCVIDDTAYLVVKLNDEYNDNPDFNEWLDKSSKYNLKGRWYQGLFDFKTS